MSVYAQDYGYFFNSNNSDRTYNADSFETWLKPFFVNGVFTGGLQVKAYGTPNMSVQVTKGYANLDGKVAYWPNNNTLTIETASGVYDRIDTIVLRRDNTNRRVSLEVVKGTASATPSPTAPTRDSDTYELVLAEVLVGVGVTGIHTADITDKRPDTDVCGYVVAAVQTPDFSELYDQFTEAFDTWFDEMKDQLSEDAAGHLQLEINALDSAKADKVTGATAGNFVALDANGNLTDSGHATSDMTGLLKGLAYVAILSNGDWKLPYGTDAAIGDYIWMDGTMGHATAAITGGSTVIGEGTNWERETDGALNSNCTPVAFTGFTPASGFVEEHNYSFMLNGVLHVQYGAKKSSGKITANTWTKIATITDSSITLPTGNFVIPCVSIGATAAARGMINANGELQIYVTGSNDCTGGCLTGMLF